MRDEGFRRAMNTVSPTPEQRERMRAALESQLPQKERLRYQGRPEKVKRLSWLPAVAALLAVAIGGGLALMKGMLPASPKPDISAAESMESAQTSSLKTLLSSPEYQARLAMENKDTDQLNALAQQFGLTVETEGADTDGWELANQLGIRQGSDGYTVTGGRYYEESGSSSFDGTTTMEGVQNWTYPISYRVCFNAWGAVVPELPVLEKYSAYGGWSTYTASNGATLILAQGQNSGVIYGIVDEGFYVVYTQDIRTRNSIMQQKDLEAFAETFRFPRDAGRSITAGEKQFAAVLAQYKDVMEGGSGRWEKSTAQTIRRRGEDSFGYAFWDLDRDGSNELLMTGGPNLYAVYAGEGEQAHAILKDDGVTQYSICSDGTIFLREDDALLAYRVEQGALITVENVRVQSDPSSPWVRVDENGITAISQEEYRQVRNSYHSDTIPFTPLSAWKGYKEYVEKRLRGTVDPDTVDPAYAAIIENYREAITQDMQPAEFAEYDISLGVASVENPMNTVGSCLRDLDGDGEDELIITDGSILYGVYTLESGVAKPIVLSWNRCYYYLCEDGYLYSEGSNSAAVTVYEFHLLHRKNLVTAETLMTDYSADPESSWFRGSTGTDDTVTPITEEEFNRALSAHGEIRKDLPFTPLSQYSE